MTLLVSQHLIFLLLSLLTLRLHMIMVSVSKLTIKIILNWRIESHCTFSILCSPFSSTHTQTHTHGTDAVIYALFKVSRLWTKTITLPCLTRELLEVFKVSIYQYISILNVWSCFNTCFLQYQYTSTSCAWCSLSLFMFTHSVVLCVCFCLVFVCFVFLISFWSSRD